MRMTQPDWNEAEASLLVQYVSQSIILMDVAKVSSIGSLSADHHSISSAPSQKTDVRQSSWMPLRIGLNRIVITAEIAENFDSKID